MDVWPAAKPLILAMKEQDWPWEVEARVAVTGNQDLDDDDIWAFLLEHEEHGLAVVSEYGDDLYPPVILSKENENSS
jgi:hypothetical protein